MEYIIKSYTCLSYSNRCQTASIDKNQISEIYLVTRPSSVIIGQYVSNQKTKPNSITVYIFFIFDSVNRTKIISKGLSIFGSNVSFTLSFRIAKIPPT